MRQSLTESFMLAIGRALGLAIAVCSSARLLALFVNGHDIVWSTAPDWRVLAFMAVVCGVLLVPLRSSTLKRPDPLWFRLASACARASTIRCAQFPASLINHILRALRELRGEYLRALRALRGEYLRAPRELRGEYLRALRALRGEYLRALRALRGEYLRALRALRGEYLRALRALRGEYLRALRALRGEYLRALRALRGEYLRGLRSLRSLRSIAEPCTIVVTFATDPSGSAVKTARLARIAVVCGLNSAEVGGLSMTIGTRTLGLAIGAVFSLSTVVAAQHGHAAVPHGNAGAAHTSSKPTKTTSAPTPTTTSPTTTTSPIATKIESHPQLAAKLTSLLPKGMTLDTAAAGFRNQGQFIAALHVSQNLRIPFADLKAQMTGDHAKSLGQSIQTLRPTADSTSAVKKAQKQAQNDVDASDK